MSTLLSISNANALIAGGKHLHIAGDETALRQLKKGNWIGGTIPYFVTADGGVVDRERVMVTELPSQVSKTKIHFVDAARLKDLTQGAFANGFSIIVIPGMSEAHSSFANKIHDLSGLYEQPMVGWIAGVHLDELATRAPLVFNGVTGEASRNSIVALHAELPENATAQVGIINLFKQGDGDRIVFQETGFSADECLINGKPASFVEYVKEHKLDPKRPLVADLSGEMINVSFQTVDDATHSVHFYAPVLQDVEYRHAAPVGDYRASLAAFLAERSINPAFSCNCILNFLYGGLEGSKAVPISGPATFGEIAYVLLNQTLVYLEIVEIQ